MQDQRLTTRLIKYWESIKKDKDIPPIEFFNPQVVGDLWQNCFVVSVRVDDSKVTYIYTYLGDNISDIFGRSMVGQRVNGKMMFTPAKKMLEQMNIAVIEPEPKCIDGQFVDEKSRMIKYRSCLLPFGHDKQSVTDFVVGVSWSSFG